MNSSPASVPSMPNSHKSKLIVGIILHLDTIFLCFTLASDHSGTLFDDLYAVIFILLNIFILTIIVLVLYIVYFISIRRKIWILFALIITGLTLFVSSKAGSAFLNYQINRSQQLCEKGLNELAPNAQQGIQVTKKTGENNSYFGKESVIFVDSGRIFFYNPENEAFETANLVPQIDRESDIQFSIDKKKLSATDVLSKEGNIKIFSSGSNDYWNVNGNHRFSLGSFSDDSQYYIFGIEVENSTEKSVYTSCRKNILAVVNLKDGQVTIYQSFEEMAGDPALSDIWSNATRCFRSDSYIKMSLELSPSTMIDSNASCYARYFDTIQGVKPETVEMDEIKRRIGSDLTSFDEYDVYTLKINGKTMYIVDNQLNNSTYSLWYGYASESTPFKKIDGLSGVQFF